MDADGKYDAHGQERRNQVRPPVAEEGQRHPFRRQRLADDAQIEAGLEEDDERHPVREKPPQTILGVMRDVKSQNEEQDEKKQNTHREDEPELLRADGEDEIRVRLGQIAVFLHGLHVPDA